MSIEEVEVLSSQDAEVDVDVEQTGTSIWNFIKLTVFRANGEEPKISHAPFVILLSLGALRLELLLIFLVELFFEKETYCWSLRTNK